ncbi:MAG: hypothetical protein K2L02_03380 [Clostridia bacterium]|nr:hypothetical protein [Clostridia bacterium]
MITMKIYLVKRSFFNFRGKESFELDLLGKNILELMQENLGAEIIDGELPYGDKVVLYPVYPFLTEEKLNKFLRENEGSFSFEGGYVVRGGRESGFVGRIEQGLFSLADYPALLNRAARENAARLSKRGVLVEEGAEVSFLAEIHEGTIVERGARIIGNCVIEKNVRIGKDSEIIESVIGENSEIMRSVLEKSRVGNNTRIGPYAYLRPNSVVGDHCRIGDFVELKNCNFGNGSKSAHLSYIGDAEVGEKVNIGCGVVFANYNGKTKSKSKVEDGCFIGSNCNLIAPVTVGAGSYLAAGTTLTKNLDTHDFCIGRCRETVKEGGAKKYLKKE